MPQHEVYGPAVAVLHLGALAQRGPGRQQQNRLRHAQLLLPAVQDPLRHLVRFPAPPPLRQAALLQRDPGPDCGGGHVGKASCLVYTVTQRGEDNAELVVGQRTYPLERRKDKIHHINTKYYNILV